MSGYRRRGTALIRDVLRPGTSSRAASGAHAPRHVRSAWSLPVFATGVVLAFVAVSAVAVSGAGSSVAALETLPREAQGPGQAFVFAGVDHAGADRDDYGVTRIVVPPPSAPAAGTPDPGTAQAIAYDMVLAKGWDKKQFDCLVALWNKESHWNVYAHNPSSGAYGIPQAVPGDKMATAGSDWKTNPRTQIKWGLGYIQGRYGTPCGAWQHSQNKGWY